MKHLMENFRKFIVEDKSNTTLSIVKSKSGETERKGIVKVGRVVYDPFALGGTPNGREVDYFGYTVWMTPQDFLKLNRTRRDEADFVAQHFQKEGDIPVAPCWISAIFDETETGTSEDPSAGVWHVDGHEGRGRAMEISKLQPNELMPVHVFPRGGKRAENLTREMVLSPIQSEVSSFTVRPSNVVWQGEIVK